MFKPQLRVLVIAYFFTFFLGDLAENLRGEALFPSRKAILENSKKIKRNIS